jgi:hypothetical protein
MRHHAEIRHHAAYETQAQVLPPKLGWNGCSARLYRGLGCLNGCLDWLGWDPMLSESIWLGRNYYRLALVLRKLSRSILFLSVPASGSLRKAPFHLIPITWCWIDQVCGACSRRGRGKLFEEYDPGRGFFCLFIRASKAGLVSMWTRPTCLDENTQCKGSLNAVMLFQP